MTLEERVGRAVTQLAGLERLLAVDGLSNVDVSEMLDLLRVLRVVLLQQGEGPGLRLVPDEPDEKGGA